MGKRLYNWDSSDIPERRTSDYNNGNSDTLGIQEALDSLPRPREDRPIGKVIVDTYGDIDAKIILRGGQHLQGMGPVWRDGQYRLPSKLRLADGVNDDMIQITSHGAGSPDQYFPMITDLHLDGNKSGNPTGGSCVYVDGQILDLELTGVITSYAKQDGFRFNNGNIKAWVERCYSEYHDRNFFRIENHFETYIKQLYTYDCGDEGLFLNDGVTHLTDVHINESRGHGIYYGGNTGRSLFMSQCEIWGCGSLIPADRYVINAWNPTNLLADNCKFGERDETTPRNSLGMKFNGDGGAKNIKFTNCLWNAIKSGYNPIEITNVIPLSELELVNCGGTSFRGGKRRFIRSVRDNFTGVLLDANKWYASATGNGVAPAIFSGELGQLRFRITAGAPGTSQLDHWGAERYPAAANPYIEAGLFITDVSEAEFRIGWERDATNYAYVVIDGGDIYLKSNDGGVHGPYSEDTGENLADNTFIDLLIEVLTNETMRVKVNGEIVGTPTVGAVTANALQPYSYLENKNNSAVDVNLYYKDYIFKHGI